MSIATLKKLFNINLENIKDNNNNIALEHIFKLDFIKQQAKHIKTIEAVTKEVMHLC